MTTEVTQEDRDAWNAAFEAWDNGRNGFNPRGDHEAAIAVIARHRLTAQPGEDREPLHVAGNGQTLTVGDVESLVERINADPIEAASDTKRMLEFLVHVIQSGEGRSGAGADREQGQIIISGMMEVLDGLLIGQDSAYWLLRERARYWLNGDGEDLAVAALNARQSGEGEQEAHLAIVECSDPNEGWSLSVKFGSGDHARDKMRALSDRLRAGEA